MYGREKARDVQEMVVDSTHWYLNYESTLRIYGVVAQDINKVLGKKLTS